MHTLLQYSILYVHFTLFCMKCGIIVVSVFKGGTKSILVNGCTVLAISGVVLVLCTSTGTEGTERVWWTSLI